MPTVRKLPTPTRPTVVDPNQLYSVREARAALALSKAAIYRLFAAGKIRVVYVDSHPRIPGAEIARIARGEPAPEHKAA